MSRSELDIAVDRLRNELLLRSCAEEKYYGRCRHNHHSLNKYRKSVEYCRQYLQKLISLENFCINMIKCGLHEDVKHLAIDNLLPINIVEKYVGYDEVD